MEEIYKINGKYQLKSISNSSKIILTLPACLLLLYIAEGYEELLQAPIYIIWFGFFLVFLLPAFYFHITYLLTNKDLTIAVDKGSQTITIRDKNLVKVLHASDIKKVIRVINPDFKHAKWQQNWQPMPWRSYGYLKVITKSNEVILLTSLMLDPLQPPISVTETQYKFLPDLDALPEDEPTEAKVAAYQSEQIERFKLKYKNYSEQELSKKTVSNGYKTEAVAAATALLEERHRYSVKD